VTTPQRWLPALLLLLPSPALAQGVVVAPHAVFIDHATRAGSITLYNPGEEPVEVTVSFAFGYPTTDSAGTVAVELADSAPAGEPGATGWLQAFPRRVTVAQQQRQTIRLLASPPASLPDGEYWARIVVAAKGGKVPVAGVPDSAAITVGLTLEIRTVISVTYRKGQLTTGVTLAPVSAQYAHDSVDVRIPLVRTGTAAYLGTARVAVVNAAGDTVGQEERAVAVYHALNPRLSVPVGPLPAGTYTARVSVSTDRADLPGKDALPAPTVQDSVEFVVR
jgi:P pilus assembly chaperone PapD